MIGPFLRPLFTWRSAVAGKHGPKSAVTRHVLLTLSLHMNELGESCFPSIRLLEVETACSRRTIIEHLRLAADGGWVGKKPRNSGQGHGWRSVEYCAQIPGSAEEAYAADGSRGKRALSKERGAVAAPRQGGAFGDERGAPDDHNVVRQSNLSSSKEFVKEKTLCPLSADQFEKALCLLPKRAGNDPKLGAAKAWNARIREGVEPSALIAGARRYAAFCAASGNVGTQYVMQAARFFGPDKIFEQEFAAPQAPAARGALGALWCSSVDTLLAKAKEFGISTRGETTEALKAQIRERLQAKVNGRDQSTH